MEKSRFVYMAVLFISMLIQCAMPSIHPDIQSVKTNNFNETEFPNELEKKSQRILLEEKLPKESRVIFFIFISLTLGGLLKHVNKRYNISYTPMLFVMGCLGGAYQDDLGQLGMAIKSARSIDPHGILIIFLPVMIFQNGYSTDWYIFRRQSGQIIILALPCVILSSLILMGFIKLLYQDDVYPLSGSFLLGTLLSWTDTVAIGAILQEIGAPKRLNNLFKGESLMNDITCVILYRLVKEVVRENVQTFWESIQYFLIAGVGGILLGILFGIVTSFWIKKIFNDEIHAVNIVLLSCYLLYFVGINMRFFGFMLNGIVPLVSFGLFMSAVGKKRINSQADKAFRQFWSYISFCAETVIFILAGVIVVQTFISSETDSIRPTDYYKLILVYIMTIIARFAAMAVFMNLLQRIGYGLTWKEVCILAYGGLKGAVGISIALIVAHDTHFNIEMRELILFESAGNCLLTLLINGPSLKYLVKYLKVTATSSLKDKLFIDFLEKDFKEEVELQVEDLKERKYLKNADWNEVTVLSGAQDQQEYIQKLNLRVEEQQKNEQNLQDQKTEQDQELKEVLLKKEENPRESENFENEESQENYNKSQEVKKQQNIESEEEDEEDQDQAENVKLEEEKLIFIRNIFLKRLKLAFWDLFDKNQCQGGSYLRLIEAVDWDLDNETSQMNNWTHLLRQFSNGYINFYSTLRNWTLIGHWAKKQLFQHVSSIYDMVHSYIEAHKIADSSLLQTKYESNYVKFILVESEENIYAAKKYLDEYLDLSFPEISESIRTQKVANNILDYQRVNKIKDIIKEKQEQGQLDEKEYFSLKKKVDQNIIFLNNLAPSWVYFFVGHTHTSALFQREAQFEDFIKAQPLFQLLNQHIKNRKDFDTLISEAIEERYTPDQYVFKQSDKATHIYVITRGVGTESYKNEVGKFSLKRGVGHILPIQQLLGTSSKYYTEFQADCMIITRQINISKLMQYTQCHHSVENHILRESLPYLSKIFYSQFAPMSSLDIEKIEDIVNKTVLHRYKKGSILEIPSGGILAKGELNLLISSDFNEEQKEEKEQQINSTTQGIETNNYQQDTLMRSNLQNELDSKPEKITTSFSIILPNQSFYTYKATKQSILFEFLQPEEIKLLVKAAKRHRSVLLGPRN